MRSEDRVALSVEAPCETIRLVRVAGRLDRSAAAGVLRLISVQLELIAARYRATAHLVIDLAAVSSFEHGGLESLRHASYSAARRGVTVHLSGCGGRLHLLPLRVCQVLAEFRTFPTAELAVQTLADRGTSTRSGAPAVPPHTRTTPLHRGRTGRDDGLARPPS